MIPTESLLYPLAAMATTVSAATLYMYLNKPNVLVQFYLRMTVLLSGMSIKYITIDDGIRVCYAERGTKKKGRSSMLLLHGFSADKSMWAPLVKNLPKDLHVIALDLPGNGDSDVPPEDEDLSFHGQLRRLHQIVHKLDLDSDPFHIVGLSMGGTLAGLYSAEYSDHVERVTMMCPAMKTPVKTEVGEQIQRIMETGDEDHILQNCPLLPKNPQEMQYLLDFAQFHKSFFIPKQILQGAVEMRRPYINFYLRLFRSIVSLEGAHILENTAHKITVPSHVVWGREDLVVHVSGVEVLKNILPNCQRIDVIPRCGHAINLDRPGSKTKGLLMFRGELSPKKSH